MKSFLFCKRTIFNWKFFVSFIFVHCGPTKNHNLHPTTFDFTETKQMDLYRTNTTKLFVHKMLMFKHLNSKSKIRVCRSMGWNCNAKCKNAGTQQKSKFYQQHSCTHQNRFCFFFFLSYMYIFKLFECDITFMCITERAILSEKHYWCQLKKEAKSPRKVNSLDVNSRLTCSLKMMPRPFLDTFAQQRQPFLCQLTNSETFFVILLKNRSHLLRCRFLEIFFLLS